MSVVQRRLHAIVQSSATTPQTKKIPDFSRRNCRQYVEQMQSKFSVNIRYEKWITVRIRYRELYDDLRTCTRTSQFTPQFGYQHFVQLPQYDFINPPPQLFPDLGPFPRLFTDLSRILRHFQVSRKVLTLQGVTMAHLTEQKCFQLTAELSPHHGRSIKRWR